MVVDHERNRRSIQPSVALRPKLEWKQHSGFGAWQLQELVEQLWSEMIAELAQSHETFISHASEMWHPSDSVEGSFACRIWG